jgi:hypothetical protein
MVGIQRPASRDMIGEELSLTSSIPSQVQDGLEQPLTHSLVDILPHQTFERLLSDFSSRFTIHDDSNTIVVTNTTVSQVQHDILLV